VKIPIYILTYRRERMLSYENLPNSLKARVIAVADAQDSERLKATYPGLRVWSDFSAREAQGRGVNYARQVILDECRHPLCITLDDDLIFLTGKMEGGRKRFNKATGSEVVRYFDELSEKALSPGVAFTTFSSTFFNTTEEPWLTNKRTAYSFFINVGEVRRVGAGFGISGPTRWCNGDINFSLECYTHGLKSYSSSFFSAKDMSKPATGGCASYEGGRARRHEESARWLADHYPRYIKLVLSKNRRHKANMGTLVDIRFYPSRAYKESKR